ncbi:MAG: Gmad2 immunoglobulin-like domain-containing protein, partial [Acidimicrobiia bacterium]|nr:Gmad2 immunoglobulin-like domain-containing protein [Acidimicrobiia bacterium]
TYHTAVWPWPESTTRFTDPVEAARSFAIDFIGFTDPIVGRFEQGDSQSGEVEIRPMSDGPATVVFVRRLGSDGTWWLLGAATENITLNEPSALSEIESPLTVAGTALAFEGQIDVALRADGVTQPLVETFATGGGDQLRPFETTVEWSGTNTGGGALVLTTSSGDDGRIWEASVTRVLFGAG